jgi:hypothetical protein
MPNRAHSLVRSAALIVLALVLAACAAAQPRLGPGPPVIAPKGALSLGPAPVKGQAVSFAVSTVTAIPGTFAFILQDELKAFAASRNLVVITDDDPTATYQVKGYISAIGDANRVMLVYVWDVFDASGNRLHRFSGQEPAGKGSVDPWTAVTKEVIRDAARETVDALAEWIRT